MLKFVFNEFEYIYIYYMASNVAIKKQENMAKLNAYDMAGSASKKMLMRTVKDMFEKGEIERFAQADGLMKLLRDNKLKEFDKCFDKLEAANKAKADEKAEKEDDEVIIAQRNTSKDIVRVKNKRSELPTFELQFINDYPDFNVAWRHGVNKLIKIVVGRLQTKKNIKVVVGVEVL